MTQMKTAFGRGTLSMLGAMFQHSSKICEQGRFLEQKDFIQYVKENGKKSLMRKGQLHPTVVMSAVKSLLSSTSAGIGPQDVFVQVCGGTPSFTLATWPSKGFRVNSSTRSPSCGPLLNR